MKVLTLHLRRQINTILTLNKAKTNINKTIYLPLKKTLNIRLK